MKRMAEAVSIRDAARQLGVSIRFVYDLVWSGKLPAQKVDKVWRIPASAIEARLKARGA
ncbi:MAG: helix-turn-helix domain-containing protein [Terriglobales bacterium]